MAETDTEVQGQEATETLEAGDFASLLNQEIRPKSEQAKEEVEQAVQTLAEQALASSVTVSADVTVTIREMIAEIDKRLTEQVLSLIHI